MNFDNDYECLDFLNKNPNFTGVCFILYADGKKEFEYNYVDGKVHGKQFEWHPNGQKRFKYNYVNDFQIGIQLYEGKTYEVKPEDGCTWHLIVKEIL